jgi:hypothetical protein
MITTVRIWKRAQPERHRLNQGGTPMRHTITIVAVLAVVFAASPHSSLAQPSPVTGRDALARALQGAWMPLENGFVVSSTHGTPNSGKYEIDDGTFQLSVCTFKADAFMEVIVDYDTGSVVRAEVITDGGDLAAARTQRAAIAAAQRSLGEATARAVKSHAGYRAVSALPSLDGGRPVVEVILLNGSDWKVVSEPLD